MDNVPLLKIELDDINSIPKIYYKGQQYTGLVRVSFDWETRGIDPKQGTYIHIEHIDSNANEGIGTKVIQHNHPLL